MKIEKNIVTNGGILFTASKQDELDLIVDLSKVYDGKSFIITNWSGIVSAQLIYVKPKHLKVFHEMLLLALADLKNEAVDIDNDHNKFVIEPQWYYEETNDYGYKIFNCKNDKMKYRVNFYSSNTVKIYDCKLSTCIQLDVDVLEELCKIIDPSGDNHDLF